MCVTVISRNISLRYELEGDRLFQRDLKIKNFAQTLRFR